MKDVKISLVVHETPICYGLTSSILVLDSDQNGAAIKIHRPTERGFQVPLFCDSIRTQSPLRAFHSFRALFQTRMRALLDAGTFWAQGEYGFHPGEDNLLNHILFVLNSSVQGRCVPRFEDRNWVVNWQVRTGMFFCYSSHPPKESLSVEQWLLPPLPSVTRPLEIMQYNWGQDVDITEQTRALNKALFEEFQ